MVRLLAERADVVVENYKVGQLARFGLDYATLAALNPRLIYCSITGFGQYGPHADRAGYDFIIQGMGGFMSITGERDDLPGGGPQKAGVAVSDLMTGMYSTVAILAALAHRERTGQGQHIDMALFDVMLAMLANMNMNYLTSGKPPGRAGNAHPNIVPYQVFEAADGHVVIAVGNDGQFVKFCEVAGCAELVGASVLPAQRGPGAQPRGSPRDPRADRAHAAGRVLGGAARSRRRPVRTDQQHRAGARRSAGGCARAARRPAASAGGHRSRSSPIRSSSRPRRPRTSGAPPTLGQHTAEVLRECGLDAAEIERLRSLGAV